MTIIEFINEVKRTSTFSNPIYTYTHGLCLDFAKILAEKFSGQVLLIPEFNHFVCMVNDHLYDITGNVTNQYKDYKKILLSDLNEKQLKGYE